MTIIFDNGQFWIEVVVCTVTITAVQTPIIGPTVNLSRAGNVMTGFAVNGGNLVEGLVIGPVDQSGGGFANANPRKCTGVAVQATATNPGASYPVSRNIAIIVFMRS